jgi:hypothetical protein
MVVKKSENEHLRLGHYTTEKKLLPPAQCFNPGK